MKSHILIILFALTTMRAKAENSVVFSNSNDTFPAVIKITGFSASCTGSVVGLNPPTVITARHCVEFGAVKYHGTPPEKIIKANFKKAFFSEYRAELPGDLAVLIYPMKSASEFRLTISECDLFTVKPMKLTAGKRIQFCGYGATTPQENYPVDRGVQVCGFNDVILENSKLDQSIEVEAFVRNNPTLGLLEFSPQMQVKWINSSVQKHLTQYENGTRFAVAALHNQAYDRDHKESIMQQGDSGGPGFITVNDEKVLLGVTSAAGFMRLMYSSEVLFGIFWRLDHSWSQDLLKQAISEGADI